VNTRPRHLRAASRRLATVALAAILAVIALTTAALAEQPDACAPDDCAAGAASYLGTGAGVNGSPTLVSYPDSQPSYSAPSTSDISSANFPYYGNPYSGAACPPNASGAALRKMILHLNQSVFPYCPFIPGFNDNVVSPYLPGPWQSCYSRYYQLVNTGAIPLFATYTFTDYSGNLCVFVNGVLTNVTPPVSGPPVTTATQACIAAFQQLLGQGQVSTVGYALVVDLYNDVCLFSGGILISLRTPTDVSLTPTNVINSCLNAWQLYGPNSPSPTTYYVIDDQAGDLCVFFGGALQYVDLPGSYVLSRTF
jgi:hypothetical protein